MNKNDFGSSIRKAFQFVNDEARSLRTVSSLSSLPVSEPFNRVLLIPESLYEDIYLEGSKLSYYNFMILDFSYFQFSWMSENSWRLAYFPNPWAAGAPNIEERIAEWEALESAGDLSDEAVSQLIDELPRPKNIPPIRFEYAVDQYVNMQHPAAHFHIGRHTENRWMSSIKITPYSFVLLIFRLYYPEIWKNLSSDWTEGRDPCFDTELISDLNDARQVHEISARELQTFHIACRA